MQTPTIAMYTIVAIHCDDVMSECLTETDGVVSSKMPHTTLSSNCKTYSKEINFHIDKYTLDQVC